MFSRRLLSFLILWAIICALFWSRSFTFAAILLTFVGVVGQWEFYKLMERSGYSVFKKTGLFFGFLTLISWGFIWIDPEFIANESTLFAGYHVCPFFDFLLLSILAILAYKKVPKQAITSPALTYFGLLYVPYLLLSFLWLLYDPSFGWKAILYCIAVTKMTDAGAYVVGSLMGRHLMATSISPRKTWEGFAGGMLFAYLTSWALAWGFGFNSILPISSLHSFLTPYLPHASTWQTADIPLTHPIYTYVLPLLLALTGMLGDLIESVIKRTAGAKDSGNIIPGMGGMLDLIDSLLLATPVCYSVLWFWVYLSQIEF